MDEKSQVRAVDRTAPILPMMPTTPARMTHDHAHHGTTRPFAALDPSSGSVIARRHRHRHQEFLRFLELIDAAWLNPVERWFAEPTNRKLRRSAHRSVTELEADVDCWINEGNADPKPFVRTKAAEDILDTLAAHCQRITDSRHQGSTVPRTGAGTARGLHSWHSTSPAVRCGTAASARWR